ncbi:cell division protein ZapD [Alcaligenaceae bacterium LF4-65]|uniref:Cell division protein ZapD n=1 Tax=Zwartia hollandica TaxID=324606 RepID=A0A953N9D4_9BURK|nr:cell division protein ZapD [Zwartia hollandica]MBZ1350383.1 cell division protein ZapD [Zwartia hollandica]
MILFEYPFNERIRALMRLESLLDRMIFFAKPGDARHHQVALAALFDLLDATERTDVKSSVLQDLERQRNVLASLKDHPSVDEKTLATMLIELEKVAANLNAVGKTGQELRANEWLSSLRGRLAVPGGGTQVDMPSFHAWQYRTEAERCSDLERWMSTLMPLHAGISMVMRLLRETGQATDAVAPKGAFQQMLAGKTYQLLRVWVEESLGVFPEISANKYMVWIRYSAQDGEHRPHAVTHDVNFKMTLCAL